MIYFIRYIFVLGVGKKKYFHNLSQCMCMNFLNMLPNAVSFEKIWLFIVHQTFSVYLAKQNCQTNQFTMYFIQYTSNIFVTKSITFLQCQWTWKFWNWNKCSRNKRDSSKTFIIVNGFDVQLWNLRYGYKMWHSFVNNYDIDVKSTLFNTEMT